MCWSLTAKGLRPTWQTGSQQTYIACWCQVLDGLIKNVQRSAVADGRSVEHVSHVSKIICDDFLPKLHPWALLVQFYIACSCHLVIDKILSKNRISLIFYF